MIFLKFFFIDLKRLGSITKAIFHRGNKTKNNLKLSEVKSMLVYLNIGIQILIDYPMKGKVRLLKSALKYTLVICAGAV